MFPNFQVCHCPACHPSVIHEICQSRKNYPNATLDKDICQPKLNSTAGKITLMQPWTFVGKVEKPAGLLADNEIVIEQSVFCKASFLSHLICSVQWLSMLHQ